MKKINVNHALTRFCECDDSVWLGVSAIINRVVNASRVCHGERVKLTISHDEVIVLQKFIEQVQFSYVHHNSTLSRRVRVSHRLEDTAILRHYHLIDVFNTMDVLHILKKLVLARLAITSSDVFFNFSSADLNCLLSFAEDFRYFYETPRKSAQPKIFSARNYLEIDFLL